MVSALYRIRYRHLLASAFGGLSVRSHHTDSRHTTRSERLKNTSLGLPWAWGRSPPGHRALRGPAPLPLAARFAFGRAPLAAAAVRFDSHMPCREPQLSAQKNLRLELICSVFTLASMSTRGGATSQPLAPAAAWVLPRALASPLAAPHHVSRKLPMLLLVETMMASERPKSV